MPLPDKRVAIHSCSSPFMAMPGRVETTLGIPLSRGVNDRHRVGIMQPYFLPYIGYFQLIGCCDQFVIYDNIKYTKKGWINRNRMLLNGQPEVFSLPLQGGSDTLMIRERSLSSDYSAAKLLRKISEPYRRARFYSETMPLLECIVNCPQRNLFAFLLHSLACVLAHLEMSTPVLISSGIEANHDLKGQDRVLDICHVLNASAYLNPTGGTDLYCPQAFAAQGRTLSFLKSRLSPYEQQSDSFVPALSIVDVLFSIGSKATAELIASDYDLIAANPSKNLGSFFNDQQLP